jgi:mannosyltransferase OCH1-like enzyme
MVNAVNFKESVRNSYAFDRVAFDHDNRWAILNELYNRNFVYIGERNYNNLPKRIHQVWLGGELPEKFKKWTDSWRRFNPEWEYKLWGDRDIEGLDLPRKEIFDSMNNYGPKSDFLRYYLLDRFGGLYIDTDFECLKSFNSLSYVDFLTGVGYPSKLELYVGIIGSVPHHPIIAQVDNALNKIPEKGWDNVLETTSSYFFTRNFFKVVTGYMKGVVVLPTEYLYPFPNSQGYCLKNGKDYIKECSYAVHHWATSWRSK